jgi:hypothetical protein
MLIAPYNVVSLCKCLLNQAADMLVLSLIKHSNTIATNNLLGFFWCVALWHDLMLLTNGMNIRGQKVGEKIIL